MKVENVFKRFIFYHLKKRGIQTVYWVLNQKEDFDRAVKAKVDCIMTDCPSYMQELLKR